MAWYDKYLSIYGKPFSEVPQEVKFLRRLLMVLVNDWQQCRVRILSLQSW